MHPKGYNPLLSALPSSFDYINEGITPEITSHTRMPEKGWETEMASPQPKGLHAQEFSAAINLVGWRKVVLGRNKSYISWSLL